MYVLDAQINSLVSFGYRVVGILSGDHNRLSAAARLTPSASGELPCCALCARCRCSNTLANVQHPTDSDIVQAIAEAVADLKPARKLPTVCSLSLSPSLPPSLPPSLSLMWYLSPTILRAPSRHTCASRADPQLHAPFGSRGYDHNTRVCVPEHRRGMCILLL